jgi:hypothetical protein
VSETVKRWMPHHPEQWPFHYMDTIKPVTLRVWNQKHPVEENTTDIPLPVGTTVKIVMASRFGDVGITHRLGDEYGYHLRVPIEELSDLFTNFRETPR